MIEDKGRKTILLIIAAASFYLGYMLFGKLSKLGIVGGISAPFIAAFFGIIGGICLAYVICPMIGNWFGGMIFYPNSRLKAPPRLIAPVRGLIESGKINNAIAELRDILQEHPYDPVPLLMLIEILVDEEHDYAQAEKLIVKFMDYDKLKRTEDIVDILMRYADCCELQGDQMRAAPLFERELNKNYSEPSLKAIKRRLNAMKAAC